MKISEKLAHLSNPQFFQENRLPAHSDHSWYECSEEAAAMGDMALRSSLDGTWKFAFAPNPASAPVGFEQLSFCCDGWNTIHVPGHMELQGYGAPQYTDTRYPWDGVEDVKPHNIPTEHNPTGCYVKDFLLPENMKGRTVHLCFEGVETAFHCWLNGVYLGYSEDSYTPAAFDITAALVPGKNKLAVEIYRFCSGSWLEDQDFWRMGGIIRSVSLCAYPTAHVWNLHTEIDVTDNYTTGVLSAEIQLMGEAQRVDYTLIAPDGTVAAQGELLGTDGTRSFDISVPNAALWSAERPNLYRLTVCLYGTDGTLLEAVPQQIGFRKVEIKNCVLYLNGQRLIFHGVNRHEFSPRKGRAIGREEMEWDIRFLKQNNFNAVRTSHYPNQSLWYRLCDEYGIYLIDEANLETHGTWHMQEFSHTLPGDDPNWTDPCIDRVTSMYERDKNHTSVIIWSIGNESWGGSNLFAMSQYLRGRDGSRPVHYEGVCHDRRYPDTTDFESRMYATVEMAEEYMKNSPAKPYILCEYSHAMGNSCGNLFEYTALEDKYPQYCGGFIWDYIDQAIYSRDPFGNEVLAFGGDFSDRPTDYNFCTDGLVYADRTPSPKIQEVKYLYQYYDITPDQTGVSIRSRNSFSDGSEYELHYLLFLNGIEIKKGKRNFHQAPLSTCRYNLLETVPEQAGEYTLEVRLVLATDTAYAQAGHEAAFGQHVYKVEKARVVPELCPVTIIDGDCTYSIVGNGFSIQYCKRFGRLSSLKYAGCELIQSPLHTLLPNFWRAPTDNDEGNELKIRCATWKTASLYPKVKNVTCTGSGSSGTVQTEYDLGNGAICILRHEIFGNGSIRVTQHYTGTAGLPELPCFGVSLKLPETFHNIRYYGLGPSENYIDRAKGARLGIFETTAQQELSGYVVPQECGNRTGVRWFTAVNSSGLGIMVESEEPFEFSALPYTCHELENAYHRYELPLPYATVLRINKRQMGVGGDNTWGARTHEAFLIPSDKEMAFTFTLRPLIQDGKL